MSYDPRPHCADVDYLFKTVGQDDTGEGYFSIARVSNPSQFAGQTPSGDYIRCDERNKIGPRGFHEWDETTDACICGRTDRPQEVTGQHLPLMTDVRTFLSVIEALPHGFIIYTELDDDSKVDAIINTPKTHHARTLQEMFKYMLEWDWAYTELGNREPIAECCHGMVEVLQIPERIKEWLLNTMPPDKIGRFLAGETDAMVRRQDDIPDIFVPFWDWFKEKRHQCRTFGMFDQ